jgi:hypothetical protein
MTTRFATRAILCVLGAAGCDATSTSNGLKSQLLAIGSPCTSDSQCGTPPFMCMTDHPSGYCSRDCDIKNGDADCPPESICQFDGKTGECHRKCNAPGDCRAGCVCSPASIDSADRASHAYCDIAPDSADGGAD